jgi:RND family efflux transporter MFP subunit
MNSRKREIKMRHWPRIIIAISVVVATLACAHWWFSPAGKPAERDTLNGVERGADEAQAPVAFVKTSTVREGSVTETITAYGTIVPAPGALQTVSVPFESQVRRIMVSSGQRISRGEVLLEIEPSPDTNLQVEQAHNRYDLAEQNLQHIKQRFDLKLATNDQLIQARQTFQQAKLHLESLEGRGVDGPREIKADVDGLINHVDVQEGSIVAPGSPLVEIVAQNRLEARLGVEPEEINQVRPDQTVRLTPVNLPGSDPVSGRIRKVSRSVDTAERLVDVFVSFPASSRFLLGEYVQGKLIVASSQGLIVPRSAILLKGGHHVLFTVKNDRAVENAVRIGLENEEEVEVLGSALQEGDVVVVLGNYELDDGMAIEQEVSP